MGGCDAESSLQNLVGVDRQGTLLPTRASLAVATNPFLHQISESDSYCSCGVCRARSARRATPARTALVVCVELHSHARCSKLLHRDLDRRCLHLRSCTRFLFRISCSFDLSRHCKVCCVNNPY